MRILTRYLLRAHIGPLLFAFVALTGVVLINTLAKRLAELAGKGLPLDVILKFFVLALPAAVALTFPMAVLVAVLYTFSTFTAENEIMALKASGVDLRRLLAPLLVAATVITGVMIWFNDRVLPESNFRWSQLYLDIARKTPTLILTPQTLNRIAPSSGGTGQVFYMRAARIEPGTNRLWDVSIYDVTNASVVRTIYADSGRALFNRAQTDLVMRLFSGHMREVSVEDPKVFRRIDFQEQRFGIPGVGNLLQTDRQGAGYRSDREMTIGMLASKVDTLKQNQRKELERIRTVAARDLALALPGARRPAAAAPASGMINAESVDARERARRTADELQSAMRNAENQEREISDYQVEIHKKYSIAVASLVFVLVGVPLALRFGGGGIGMVIATSMVIFSVYYVGLIGGESLAGRGFVRPWAAMWVVNVVMTVFGLIGLATTGRETSTARTGAFDGIVQALRNAGAIFRRRKVQA